MTISGEGVNDILPIEQNAQLALEVSRRGYVLMESGEIHLPRHPRRCCTTRCAPRISARRRSRAAGPDAPAVQPDPGLLRTRVRARPAQCRRPARSRGMPRRCGCGKPAPAPSAASRSRCSSRASRSSRCRSPASWPRTSSRRFSRAASSTRASPPLAATGGCASRTSSRCSPRRSRRRPPSPPPGWCRPRGRSRIASQVAGVNLALPLQDPSQVSAGAILTIYACCRCRCPSRSSRWSRCSTGSHSAGRSHCRRAPSRSTFPRLPSTRASPLRCCWSASRPRASRSCSCCRGSPPRRTPRGRTCSA